MDPSVLSQLNSGWGMMIQNAQVNAQHDGRALGAAIWASMIRADNGMAMADLNVAARTPTTLEHPLYPGVAK